MLLLGKRRDKRSSKSITQMQRDLQIWDVKLMDVNVLDNWNQNKGQIISTNKYQITIMKHPTLSLDTRTKITGCKIIEHSRDTSTMTIITNYLLLLINSKGNQNNCILLRNYPEDEINKTCSSIVK